jgi:hypothetical protein
MQSAPIDTGSTRDATNNVSPKSSLKLETTPKESEVISSGSSKSASSSSSTSPEAGSTFTSTTYPAIYIGISDDESIEEIISSSTSTTSILYDPAFDDITREIAQLASLRTFMEGSPAMLWHWYELVPNATDALYTLSLENEGLRHALLATATVIRDALKGPEQSDQYLLERNKSLHYLQMDISQENITDALAFAVLLHISMDVLSGRMKWSQRHLRGLFLVFQRLKQQANAQGRDLSPIVRLLQRMIVRTDLAMSSLYADENQFESLAPEEEVADRRWLTQLSGPSKGILPRNIEWILASFEVDNLMHRAYAFGRHSAELRATFPPDPLAAQKIENDYQSLMQGLELWKQRSIVVEQEDIERYARIVTPVPSDPALRFLHHEPLYLQDRYYAKLLNQWRTIMIWVSLIIHPVPGPGPYSHNRYAHAVDICRTHAALGREAFVGPSWQCLYFAGLAFGGSKLYPMESRWCLEQLELTGRVFPMVAALVKAMPSVWEADAFAWTGLADLFEGVGLMDS